MRLDCSSDSKPITNLIIGETKFINGQIPCMESLSFIVQDIIYKLNAFLVEFFGSNIGEILIKKGQAL